MRRTAVLVCIALLSLASLAGAQTPSRVTLRAMNLEIELPPGWVLDPDPGEFTLPGGDTLTPAGTEVGPTIEVLPGLGWCDQVIDRYRRNTPPAPRLALVPQSYHPTVAYPDKGQAGMQYVHACIGTGRETLHVRLRFMLHEDNSAVTTVLAAIARAYESRRVASQPTTVTRPAAPTSERRLDDIVPAPGPTSMRTTRLSGTGLAVAVPNGWIAQPSKDPGIDHIVGERETVIVARVDRTSDCGEVVRYYAKLQAATARPRPSFAPASFHPRVVVSPAHDGEDAYTMCLSKPPIMYVIEALFAPSTSASPELVALLQSIADAIQGRAMAPTTTAATPSRPTSRRTSVARAGMTYERAWQPKKLELPSANTFAVELWGTALSPTSPVHSDMASSYGVAGGLARLKLGTPEDGLTLASELVAVGGYANASGITADVRAGVGAAFTAGETSRIGLVAGIGVDGIGIGQDEDDPERLVLPFAALVYATAAVRTSLGEGLALQLAGSYRTRPNETEYLGEVRLHVIGLRPWSIGTFYKDIEIARVIGAGVALAL